MSDERQRLSAMLNRTNGLSDRLAARISQRIVTRTRLHELDGLFDQAHKVHILFVRVYARYEATQPQFIRDLWAERIPTSEEA